MFVWCCVLQVSVAFSTMTTNEGNYEIIETDNGEILLHNLHTDTYSFLEEPPREPHQSTLSTVPCSAANPNADETNHKLERQNVWSKMQTLMLLNKFKLKKKEFENPRFKKIDLFKDIAAMLQNELKCQFTPVQCQNRMKTLINKYKEIRDHNNTSGKDRKDWEYFDHVADVMGDRPNIVPVASCSSIGMAKKASTSFEESETEQTPKLKKKKIEKRATPRGELQKFLREYKLGQDEKEKRRLEMMERHHEENTDLLQQLIAAVRK